MGSAILGVFKIQRRPITRSHWVGGDGLRMNRGNSLTGLMVSPMTMEMKTTYNFFQRRGMTQWPIKQVRVFSNGLIN